MALDDRARVLLILPRDVLDRARVFAGRTMAKLKGPVSLQMVLRALIDEGLKQDHDRLFVANVESQVRAVRAVRSRARRASKSVARVSDRTPRKGS